MAKAVTTIYIGDSAIQLMTARGRRVHKWDTLPLEHGLVRNGVIHDEDAVAGKIREMFQSQGIAARKVIAGISGRNCVYRLLKIPNLPQNMVAEAVEREAASTLGVSVERLYLAWQVLISAGSEMSIYLVALPKNMVDSTISTLRKAGLNPYLMDLKPLALARTATEPRAILMDVRQASLDIIIMSGSLPQVIRSLSLPIDATPEERIPEIREELDRAVTFYNSSHTDSILGDNVPLLVSGDLAEHEDTWERLVNTQPRPVRVLPPTMEAPEGFPYSQYVTNIGLALKEVLAAEKGAITYSAINFNALPLAYIPKQRSLAEMAFRPALAGGIALIAVGAFLSIVTHAQNISLQGELEHINQLAISQHVTSPEIVALNSEVSSIESRRNAFKATLDDFAAGQTRVIGDLGVIDNYLVDLSKISYSGDSITVDGTGDNNEAIFSYARELRSSGKFSSVVITKISGEDFTIKLSK